MPLTQLGVGTALASLAPLLEYFRPTRSPYLLVVVFSVAGLIVLNVWFSNLFIEKFDLSIIYDYPVITRLPLEYDFYWFWLAIPVALVLFFLTIFTFAHKVDKPATEDLDELEGQLKFARSLCILSAVLCLVIGGIALIKDVYYELFTIHYLACFWQIAVFLVYTATRLKKEEPSAFLNHFQVALVTSSFLIGATICMTLIDPWKSFECKEIVSSVFSQDCYNVGESSDGETIYKTSVDRFFLTAAFFYILWIWCQVYWVKRLSRIIVISVRD